MDGLATRLAIRLTPRGGRDAIDGIITFADGQVAVAARVRSVPADGAANASLRRLLAEQLDVPVAAIEIVSGQTSRLKQVRIARPLAQLEPGLERAVTGK